MESIKSGEILCVGTELLVGQIVNTNASFLAGQLTALGISSYYQTVVGDNPERILSAMQLAGSRSDLIVVTGGLGPTMDDLTMSVAAKLTGQALVMHLPSREAIQAIFRKMGRMEVTENNWKQAMLPEKAIVLPNRNGTAPGAILEYHQDGRNIVMILLPGPPAEMQPMFVQEAVPWLEHRIANRFKHVFIRLIGIGESSAETKLLDLIERQDNPSLAPYASEGEVVFRITQLFPSKEIEREPDRTEALLQEIQNRVGEYIYEIGNRKMPEVVKDLLIENKQSIGFAESCTAGLLSAAIADYPGVSKTFRGSVIAYDNAVKKDLLGVSDQILTEQGAVSEACAIAMAVGCRKILGTDIAVSVTGIAGPDGGTVEKPVGLIWLAVVSDSGVETRRLHLFGDRNRIRRVAALNALDLARRQLL